MDTSAGHPDHNHDRVLNQGLTHARSRSLATLSSLPLQNALDVIEGIRGPMLGRESINLFKFP